MAEPTPPAPACKPTSCEQTVENTERFVSPSIEAELAKNHRPWFREDQLDAQLIAKTLSSYRANTFQDNGVTVYVITGKR